MTGYRAFSYQFVKRFPVLSKGFEIETEMSIHAVDKNMSVRNVVIDYRDRPEGSESKFNIYLDGVKVLRTIFCLHRDYRPLRFFDALAIVLMLMAAVLFIPIFEEYLNTGLFLCFSTLIVSEFITIVAIQSLFADLILSNNVMKEEREFEFCCKC